MISDLTEFDVQKETPKPNNLTRGLFLVGLLLVALFLLIGAGVVGFGSDGPEATGSGGLVESEGLLSGTWDMYFTNSEGTESIGFTVRFIGADAGTVEILEDTTVRDASFDVDGDQVRFTFTRVFDLPTGDWPETSVFEGTLTGDDRMIGEWERQDWSCEPGRDPVCKYGEKPTKFRSRLVRK